MTVAARCSFKTQYANERIRGSNAHYVLSFPWGPLASLRRCTYLVESSRLCFLKILVSIHKLPETSQCFKEHQVLLRNFLPLGVVLLIFAHLVRFGAHSVLAAEVKAVTILEHPFLSKGQVGWDPFLMWNMPILRLWSLASFCAASKYCFLRQGSLPSGFFCSSG